MGRECGGKGSFTCQGQNWPSADVDITDEAVGKGPTRLDEAPWRYPRTLLRKHMAATGAESGSSARSESPSRR